MNKNQLRKTSAQFRRISGQFLSMESEEEFNYLLSLLEFIDNDVILSEYINKCSTTKFDIEGILNQKANWRPLTLPSSTEELISFVYQLLDFFRNNPSKLFGTILMYSSSNTFSDKYKAFTRKTVAPFINYLLGYLETCIIDAKEDLEYKPKQIFLSYCSKDNVIADIVDERLTSLLTPYGIHISRDIRDVKYKESFRQFMNNIEQHDYVIMIVSDSYLKSRPCMYEVVETMKNSRYENKMLFIVLSEKERKYYKNIDNDFVVGANVYDTEGRIRYSSYWQEKEDLISKLIQGISDPLNIIEPAKELKIIKKIRLDIDDFTSMLSDRKGIPFETMYEDNFKQILDIVTN